jgi:catechol 2,3-dioxygenase-like lactoylglutathione lyase family enzyme
VKLNHIDIQVADVPPVVRFLADHFDLQPLTRLDSPALAVLTDGHGFSLVIQRRKRDTDVLPEGFHIGFLVDDPQDVVRQRERLAAAGLPVSPVETNGRGTMCYCRGPGDLLVETSCRTGTRLAL